MHLRISPIIGGFLIALLASSTDVSAVGRELAGIVVDSSGRAVPRAFVRAFDGAAHEIAATFADEAGRFRLPIEAQDCRVQASLTGFTSADADCGEQPLRITLGVAPIQETVVVTATRTEAPSGQVGASITAFTAAEIERRRVPFVADLLRTTPGASLITTGPPGGVTSLFVRGGESSYNKVLLDGIPLNEPGGTFNFSNLTTENLERVEIVRGAQSALFGSDAMSSVVQLITRRADPGARRLASATIETGTYATLRGGASAAAMYGPFDYSVAASALRTDNRDPNSAFRNTTLSGTAGIAIGTSATLRFVGRGELQHNGTPGQTAFGRPDMDAFFDRRDGVAGVAFDHQVNARMRERANYAFTFSRQQSTNLVEDPPFTPRFEGRTAPFEFTDFPFDTLNTMHRHHASYQADVRLVDDASAGDHLLTLLVDYDGERATLDDRLSLTRTNGGRDNAGLGVQHQAVWRRLVATAGGRFEHNASFGDAAVPRASIVVVAHEGGGAAAAIGDTRLHASAGLGIKEPTLLQSLSPSPFFRGNPDLVPERSRSAEAGIEQRLAGDRARIEATWFDNRYRNLISTRTTNEATFEAQYFNIGSTRARGVELATDVAPVAAVRLRGGYTFLDSEIVDSTSPANAVLRPGAWLFRRPRHAGFAGASWVAGRVTADLNGTFVGRFVDSDFASLEPPMQEHPAYGIWSARASVRVARRIDALLSVDNLTNNDYMEPLGYRALGRAVRVGLRAGF